MKYKAGKKVIRFLALLMAIPLAVTPVRTSAAGTTENVTCGVAWEIEGGTLTISKATALPDDRDCKCALGEMCEKYTNATGGNTVPWNDQMENITSLVVEDGVTKLCNRVCNGASSLTSVSLPEGLTYIGERSFSNCTQLADISLPNSLTYLEPYAFTACKGLTVVDLSNTQITSLGTKAFAGCENLTTLSIPSTVKSIGDTAFGTQSKKPTEKLETLNYGGTLEDWKKVTISSVDNPNLTDGTCIVCCTDGKWNAGYTISGTVCYKIDGDTLYIRCDGAMPNYDQGAAPWYANASSITKVILEDGITSVGSNAFEGFPENLIYTYSGDFDALKANSSQVGNTALFKEENVNVTGGVAWTLVDGVLTISPATIPESGYESGVMRTDYENNAEKGVPWFNDRATITKLVVEDGVTVLGNRVCQNATNLTEVNLPSGLTTIGDRCFSDCYALTSITLPDSVTTLGTVMFNGCTSLTEVDIRNTKITSLPRKTFAACSSLTTLKIPGTVTSIENDCFGDTKINSTDTQTNKLTVLHFDGTLAAWNDGSWLGTTGNTNLTNGTCTVYCTDGIWIYGYKSMGGNLVYKIENGVLTIEGTGVIPDYEEGQTPWYADAESITSLVLDDGITSVGKNAFDGFTNLVNVELTGSVTTIGENAFMDCSNLGNVYYIGTSAQWDALQNASKNGNDPLFKADMTSGYSGECGDNARWDFDPETKTLTIRGTGPMWDWNLRTYKETPWSAFNANIEKIMFKYGITATGRYAFCHLEALKELEFEVKDDKTTVETIGGYGFCWNNTLETLTLPEGVRFISGRAFSRVESIKTVYLPSTLESVDMYAFMSNDSSITISNVYYNGTKEDWDRVYVSTQGDNDKYLLPDNDTTWHYLKEYTYYTDVTDDAWYRDAVYYLKDQAMIPDSGSFGAETTATMDWVLNALYVRAGFSGAYVDALDWAKIRNIVAEDTTAATEVSLNVLADILYRTTLYNGNPADLGDETALAWCQDYIPTQLGEQEADAALTRAQAASVLAAYLKSDKGSANRYDEMLNEMKEAYTTGGDGKMYILALHHAGTGKVGDSTLIVMPGGEIMLIDTFRNDGWKNYLKATLDAIGVKQLDYLVLSHDHSDHSANLEEVIDYIYDNGYTISNYWSAGSTTTSVEKGAITTLEAKGGVNIEKKLRAGHKLTIGSGSNTVTVDILWPTTEGIKNDTSGGNDGSLTMKLTYGDSSYLCGGDLFLTAEEDILEIYKDNPDMLKADVLKTNHHGSYSSNGRAWVGAIDPKMLITHSDDSGDSAQCYEYSRDGRAWFAAGRDGGIMVVMDNEENITITTGFDTNLRKDSIRKSRPAAW